MRKWFRFTYAPVFAASLLTPAMDTSAKSLPIDKWPAARRNVVKKTVGGKEAYFLRTSKLRRVNNYMFSCTAVPQHIVGNHALDTLIRQAALAYGETGVPAFKVVDLISGNTTENAAGAFGSKFSLDTLRAADVNHFVSSSHLSKMDCMSDAMRTNIGRSISEYGIGYIGSHGSGDGGTNEGTQWKYYLDTINPGNPDGHGTRDERTQVYVSDKNRKHVVTENVIIQDYVTSTDLLKHIDANGNAQTISTPFRWLRFEPYRYRNSMEGVKHAKVLLKYNPGQISDIPVYANWNGSNNFSWVIASGRGHLGYFPMGHDPRELDDFKGLIDNVGGKWHNMEDSQDLIRYVGQMLFFLAGYNEEACAQQCEDLPLVDANDNVVGKFVSPSINAQGFNRPDREGLRFDPNVIAVGIVAKRNIAVELTNSQGVVLDKTKGSGPMRYRFTGSQLPKGLYFLKVVMNGKNSRVKRYLVL